MRAVLAILKDSLREAIASRVLAVAVFAIIAVLLILTPLSLTIGASTGLRPYEVPDLPKLAEAIVQRSEESGTAAGHIWSLLPENTQKSFKIVASAEETQKAKDNGRRVAGRGELLGELNKTFGLSEFFKPEAFASVELSDELKTADTGLSKEFLAAKNLKRFAVAFSDVVQLQSDTAMSLNYGSVQMFGPLPLPPKQREWIINETIIVVLGLFLGFLGIFTSVIVTAAIIPRALEPGEISLLLSKPIRRSTLFLTKFAGGCVFTLICAMLLVGGVWLILWLRMGIWKPELMLCIPLYLFLFAVYSSVSSLAGVIWRNTTVSLVIVVLFWILTTAAGGVHNFMAYINLPPKQIAEIAVAKDQVFVMHRGRNFSRWDAQTNDWIQILESSNGNLAMRQFEQMGAAARVRLAASVDGDQVMTFNPGAGRTGSAQSSLISGKASEGFMRENEGSTPDPVFAVCLASNGQVLLPGTQGILSFNGTTDQEKKLRAFLGDTGVGQAAGRLLIRRRAETFSLISTKWENRVAMEAGVAFNRADDSFAYWDAGRLWTVNRQPDGSYADGPSRTFEPVSSAVLGTGGKLILAATSDGRLLACDRDSLETIAESRLLSDEKPRIAEVAPDGQHGAVLTHGGRLIWFNTSKKTFESWPQKEIESVSAIAFDGNSAFFVGSGRSVTKFNSENLSMEQKFAGKVSMTETLYNSIVHPIYLLLPKPGEMDFVVRKLVTGESSEVINQDAVDTGTAPQEDLNRYRITRNLQQAFWSTAAFIAVMLGISCVLLMRADF